MTPSPAEPAFEELLQAAVVGSAVCQARAESLGGKSGRRPGCPDGQPGTTLSPVEVPDRLVVHEPGPGVGCGSQLAGAPVVGVMRRQVFDLPEPVIEVTEHQLIARRCQSAGR